MLLPNLYQYSDYRQFLKDCYASNKARHSSFSYRYLARRAGINSAPYYKFIMEGKRNLSKATLLKTCQALGLKDKDAEYFENLVFFNQAGTMREKNQYFDRLTKLRGHFEQARLHESQYAYFGRWYHCAVRELLHFAPLKSDPKALAALLEPGVTPREAEESIRLLQGLGLVRKDAQGRWHPVDPVLSTGDQIASQTLINFQLKMLDLAREAFDRWSPEDRLMSSTTLSVSKNTWDLIKKKLRLLRAELLELARLDEKPERVIQLSQALFPLSKTAAGAEP